MFRFSLGDLAGELVRLAARPRLGGVLDRIDRRRGGRVAFSDAVDAIDQRRSAR